MTGKIYHVQDGLSQGARGFPELAKGFVSIDSRSETSILEQMKEYARENGSPHFFDNVDLDKVVEMMNSEADGKTDPAVALYAACAKLMGHVQDSLNRLPDDRIDFYYRNVLKESNRDAEGDRAIVTLDVDNDDVSCMLPQGTRFSAGENSEGKSIEFESVCDSSINNVRVAQIWTVAHADGYPITQMEIPVYKPKEACGQKLTPYPLFGLTRSNEILDAATFSRVGLCISNRIFFMSSGVRNVKMNFIFVPSSLRNTVIDSKSGSATAFSSAFSNAFKLSLTTENGWFDIEDYKIGCHNINSECPENQISLEFSLKDSDPAIVNYDTEIHGGNYRSKYPVLRIIVNPRKSRVLWETLAKVKMQDVRIVTNVTKCRNIAVSNEYGPASTLLPVQPFGALPNVGSSFILGSAEICGKKIDSFDVHGKWCGLPNCKDFSEWYSLYENPPHTSDFMISLSGLYGGLWYPSEEQVTCNLFKSKNVGIDDYNQDGISPDFDISFDNIVCSRTSEVIPKDENFMYSPMMKDGFFKMKLIAPSKAFMHHEIGKTVCDSFLAQVFKKKGAGSMPNQPYTPALEDLFVNYSAYTNISVAINESQDFDDIFFLHPFGFNEREPFYMQNGALYLGLSFDGKPKKVSFYFMLNRDSATGSRECEKCNWSYLGEFGWKKLPDENCLADSTADFTTSGIVTLKLPSDMSCNNTLMPCGYYWIRISPSDDSWRACSRLLTVFTQSLEVKRICGFEKGKIPKHCPSQTINELTTSIAGLSTVYQFEESFGGKVHESDAKMRIRVAESLYHRNRCVCAEDYERMILERFPEVIKVKCFPHVYVDEKTGHCDFSCPGSMVVVPVSSMFHDGSFQWDPCLNGAVLRDIREFLQSNISGMAKVCVFNPFFDKLQVRCNIQFRRRTNQGEILLDLNKKINCFLSPWFTKAGGITNHFGWNLDKAELKSYIESLDYVEHVGDDFTVMKIASADNQKFFVNMFDESNDRILRGSLPWSIPAPMWKHFINEASVNNGYGGLEIGQTFIIRKK